MQRDTYQLFSEGRIGPLTMPNRLVRSATWDPSILQERRMSDAVLAFYRRVAAGGVGTIITGDFSAVPDGLLGPHGAAVSCSDAWIEGFGKLVLVVRDAAPRCKIVAQISAGYPGVAPSAIRSPYPGEPARPLSASEIGKIVDCLAKTIAWLKGEGFDGVQLHAAHGGLLSSFLSPYANRRRDTYGGSERNRARIIQEIVSQARTMVGAFPIMIKMNCTDFLNGGIDGDEFTLLADAVEAAGIDAIEISGGHWDCLARTEAELGFRPVPAPESHTRLKRPERQSYFLRYVERLALGIPIILVGGNRDVERLERILRQGMVDFIALCRPLISEPDLPARWREGRGSSGTDCVSCNSCIYEMYTSLDRGEPGLVRCLVKDDRSQVRAAQAWLSSWAEENILREGGVDGLR